MATGRKFYLLNKIINNEIKITRLDLIFHFIHKVDAYLKLIIFMQNFKTTGANVDRVVGDRVGKFLEHKLFRVAERSTESIE